MQHLEIEQCNYNTVIHGIVGPANSDKILY